MQKRRRKAITESENTDIVPEIEEPVSSLASVNKEKRLREELRRCERERKEYLEGWQRLKADCINMRRNFQEESVRSAQAAERNFIHDILPVLDNFNLAISDASAQVQGNTDWHIGITRIHQQLTSILKDHGVEELYPLGELFDPRWHESASAVNVQDKSKDGEIVAVLKRGYKIGDEIVRPAVVHVGEYRKSSET